jgi:hypothetical protein
MSLCQVRKCPVFGLFTGPWVCLWVFHGENNLFWAVNGPFNYYLKLKLKSPVKLSDLDIFTESLIL